MNSRSGPKLGIPGVLMVGCADLLAKSKEKKKERALALLKDYNRRNFKVIAKCFEATQL